MWRIFGPIIHCNCSFFQKDLAEFVVRYCSIEKLPWNFLLRFESSAWPMLFATMATLSVSIVSMRLGSFTYSTFGSHCGQSFKLFYKKIKKPLHKQGLHPAEIPKALKRDGLLGFTTRIIWKLRLTSFVVNLPRSGRPQKLSMEANSVCRNCAK